ncbi:MAG: glycosyltransferase family 4 protein [Sphingomonadales bacterium]
MNVREILDRDVAMNVPGHAVSILTRANPGLETDGRLVGRLVGTMGLSSHIYYARRRNGYGLPARLCLRARLALERFEAPRTNIFVQDVKPGWLDMARRNVLIPNQEFCAAETVGLLGRIDMVICKSRHAEEIFRGLGCNARYTGFTCEDRYDPDVPRTRNRFLHVAGVTKQKGSKVLLDLWRAHPEWPELVALVRSNLIDADAYAAPNITLVSEMVPSARLAALQNECAVHVCPSEAEGFGLALCEGLACGAVVVTTDGPPMNELIRPEHGVLVPYRETRPRTLGMRHFVDPDALAAAIDRIVAMDEAEIAEMGRRARRFYLDKRAAFERRFVEALAEIHG